jgi:hypothetical protein
LERTGRERGVEPNGMDLSCPMRPLERWAMKMRRLVIVKGVESLRLVWGGGGCGEGKKKPQPA